LTAHRLKAFTVVRYLSSIVEIIRTASPKAGELFSA
jgi:hypothetical protein